MHGHGKRHDMVYNITMERQWKNSWPIVAHLSFWSIAFFIFKSDNQFTGIKDFLFASLIMMTYPRPANVSLLALRG